MKPRKQSALMLSCIAKYYCALRDGQLPALGVNMGKHFVPLDMGQFKNLGSFLLKKSAVTGIPLVGGMEVNHESLYNKNPSNWNGQTSCT